MIVLSKETRKFYFLFTNDVGNPKVPYNLDFNYFVSGQISWKEKIKLAMLGWINIYEGVFTSQIYRNYLPSPE